MHHWVLCCRLGSASRRLTSLESPILLRSPPIHRHSRRRLLPSTPSRTRRCGAPMERQTGHLGMVSSPRRTQHCRHRHRCPQGTNACVLRVTSVGDMGLIDWLVSGQTTCSVLECSVQLMWQHSTSNGTGTQVSAKRCRALVSSLPMGDLPEHTERLL